MDAKPSFETYLRHNRLVDEKYVSYYNNWVRQFVAYCGGKMPNLNWEMMSRFLASLEKSREDWQVRQASDALTIYTGNYPWEMSNIEPRNSQLPSEGKA